MKMKTIETDHENKKASFILEDTDASFANALRRTVLENVPTMAVEDIEIRKNSSVLYDETIAHRVGMIPLTTDLESYKIKSNPPSEEEEGSASYEAKLTLKKQGPCMVLASDFKSTDPEIKPAYPDTPVVELLKDQALEIEATAVLGTGKEHAKWAPAHIYYKQKPIVKIGNVKNPDQVIEKTPSGVFESKGNSLQVNEKLLLKHDLAGAAEEASDGQITIEPSNDYIFYIESFGQLSCRQIMEKAADILKERLQEFQKLLK